MSRARAGVLLLVVQMVLVLSVAGKYLYERETRPRVWVRAANYDPNLPVRGRYLALQLLVDTCGLQHTPRYYQEGLLSYQPNKRLPGRYEWMVTLAAKDGKLVPVIAEDALHPDEVQHLSVFEDAPCALATVNPNVEFFIPDTAKGPLPLKKGEELWVEVTVPETGLPRPVQLATSDADGFHLLKFN